MTAPVTAPPDFNDEVGVIVSGLRSRGREILGIGGETDRRPLRQILAASGVSLYPASALLLLAIAQTLQGAGLSPLLPEIGQSFGLGPTYFVITGTVISVLAFVAPLAVARYTQNVPRRAMVLLASAGLWCLTSIGTPLATSIMLFTLAQIVDTVTTTANDTVAGPLLIDSTPPRARIRVLAILASATLATGTLAPALVAVLSGPANLSWRGVSLVLAGVSLVLFLCSLGLRDPGYGRFDTELLREETRTEVVAEGVSDSAAPPLTLIEAVRRVMQIPTQRLFMIATLIGATSLPLQTYLAFALQAKFALTTSQLAWLAFTAGVTGVVSYMVLAPIGDRIYQRNPRLLFLVGGALEAAGAVAVTFSIFAPSVLILFLINAAVGASTGLFGPASQLGSYSIVPAALRPHTGAMFALFGLAGTVAGTVLFGGLQAGLGIAWTAVIALIPTLIGVALIVVAGYRIVDDIDQMAGEVVEDEAVAQLRARGRPIPLLSGRGLDFSYGATQVLFEVDFRVEEGERLALLGTNGAGKSTLLRLMSGLEYPDRGTVRLDGYDITHVGPERRSAFGIMTISGGRAVFGDLSVVENLLCFGHSQKLSRRTVQRHLDTVFATFPALAARRQSRADLLSGGEQQMLALGQALIMRPRLLLIDELSLGLGPQVVDQLLRIVREINQAGTSIVIVEQSLNVALTIAERAYFMERGRVAFSGPTAELVGRDDLARSIFLAGAIGGRAER